VFCSFCSSSKGREALHSREVVGSIFYAALAGRRGSVKKGSCCGVVVIDYA